MGERKLTKKDVRDKWKIKKQNNKEDLIIWIVSDLIIWIVFVVAIMIICIPILPIIVKGFGTFLFVGGIISLSIIIGLISITIYLMKNVQRRS